MNILHSISQSEQFEAICAATDRNGKAALFGVHQIHCAAFAAAIAQRGRAVFFVTETDAQAVTAASDISALGVPASSCPSRDFIFIDVASVSHDTELARLSALGRAMSGESRVLCASIEALCQRTMPPEVFRSGTLSLKKGRRIQQSTLVSALVSAGYSRCDRVEGRGQFAVRGGIVDIFPPADEHPLRIELFGDDIDGIARFDEENQRRISNSSSALITPVREVVLGADAPDRLRAMLKSSSGAPNLCEIIEHDISLLENDIVPPCTDRYLLAAYDTTATALDYLDDALLFICEPQAVRKRHKNLITLHTEELLSLKSQGLLPKKHSGCYADDFDALTFGRAEILADSFTRSTEESRLDALINVRGSVVPRWSGELVLLEEDIQAGLALGYSCVVLAATARGAAALANDLRTAGFDCIEGAETPPPPPSVSISVGSLSSGFQLAAGQLCVLTSAKETKTGKKRARHAEKQGHSIARLEDLKAGDFVVHDSHGIGRFEGIHRIDHHGFVRDYIKIAYRGADVLYVPVTQLDLVSQYVSPRDDAEVKLAKLHSGEWAKTKAAVYRSVREMAKELIELYAVREKEQGVAFSPDGEWQNTFESRFEYDETDDQLRAIADIKKDMERARPMDRVLCGDVGVGKTEVALRAAFKCINDGYQCAVLVPTTILAWQHYRTFCERMEAFPVKIAMLSRFASAKEIKEAVAGIKRGTVDIVIGTHRLLQKDIEFKKLGLLVIDEEQRFGVSHKEKLKQKFTGVDVLTLSATPIPRTLNMALSGIRDMSVIDEPPEDRHPVQTFVIEHDDSIVSDAIKRELSRGGQVYYIHNRIDSIERCANHLLELIPDARIEIAHGRMPEDVLSDVWRRLLGGECDVLVCTTLIETGVDVPNCNTLIVEDADRMGLSQLYQIRGRVGRSGRRAFAYFTFRRDKTLSDIATKRLTAIRDFTSFGSGFKIAMRDLQIRGAGSVLSARQSGHMQAVGYDTYLKILAEAVGDESGVIRAAERVECTVDLSVSAYLPNSYVPDNESRIELYKRIAAIYDQGDADDVLDELRDRFGEPPECVRALVCVSLIRAIASLLKIYEVSSNSRETVSLYTDRLDGIDLSGYIKQKRRKIWISPKGKKAITAQIKPGEQLYDVALEVLCACVVVDTGE